jgi:hypothetical protein
MWIPLPYLLVIGQFRGPVGADASSELDLNRIPIDCV